jgi:hypothetical protein
MTLRTYDCARRKYTMSKARRKKHSSFNTQFPAYTYVLYRIFITLYGAAKAQSKRWPCLGVLASTSNFAAPEVKHPVVFHTEQLLNNATILNTLLVNVSIRNNKYWSSEIPHAIQEVFWYDFEVEQVCNELQKKCTVVVFEVTNSDNYVTLILTHLFRKFAEEKLL